MPVDEVCRLHVRISGRVQGVGFRAFVQDLALRVGIKGWVRNRWDGTVEVIAEARKEILEQFLGSLRRGPRSGYVSDVQFDWFEANEEFQTFVIRGTG